MKRRKAKAEKHNTKIAVFFVIFVCLIILGSFILKIVYIVGQGKFDGNNRFTISVSNNKNFKILSFSPNTDSISILYLKGEVENIDISKFLAAPIDGFIRTDFLDVNKNNVSDFMFESILNYKSIKTDLTIVDIFRLFLASKTTPSKNVLTSDISTSLPSDSIDKIIREILKDERIEEEDLSIEIVNATVVTGLGSRLGRLVLNMGGKVVQVSSENIPQKTSMILYNGDKTYTIEKLHDTLGFKLALMDRQSIGDIILVIGEDSIKTLNPKP